MTIIEDKRFAQAENYFEDYFFDFCIEVCGDRVTIWNDSTGSTQVFHRKKDRAEAINLLAFLYDTAAKHKKKLPKENTNPKK